MGPELAPKGQATIKRITSGQATLQKDIICLKLSSGPRCSLSFNFTSLLTSRTFRVGPSQVPKAS